MALIGIVAVDRAGAIGRDGRLPWHYSADMKHFKETTSGNAVVMGRRTWRTLDKPLVNRLNIVLSRSDHEQPRESVLWIHDKASVLSLNEYLKCDLFVIGGAQIFEVFREEIQQWIVTEVPLTVEGADTFMPVGYLEGFRETDRRSLDDELVVKVYRRA
jgi:dihydrofolate reductase